MNREITASYSKEKKHVAVPIMYLIKKKYLIKKGTGNDKLFLRVDLTLHKHATGYSIYL